MKRATKMFLLVLMALMAWLACGLVENCNPQPWTGWSLT